VQAGNPKVAIVADDLVSTKPWTPSYLRIYGTAELVERQGQFGPAPYMHHTHDVVELEPRRTAALPRPRGRRHRTVHEAPVGQN
jgi:hypothetical protein